MKLQSIRPTAKFAGGVEPIHPLYENPPYGIFSRIAREVGVSVSFARKVALGINTSARVATVALHEAERIAEQLKRQEKRRKKVAA